jgi:hypothetical protein
MATVEGAPGHGAVAHLLPQTYKRMVASWLEEDTPSFDYGGFVVGDDLAEAKLLGKSQVRFTCHHYLILIRFYSVYFSVKSTVTLSHSLYLNFYFTHFGVISSFQVVFAGIIRLLLIFERELLLGFLSSMKYSSSSIARESP